MHVKTGRHGAVVAYHDTRFPTLTPKKGSTGKLWCQSTAGWTLIVCVVAEHGLERAAGQEGEAPVCPDHSRCQRRQQLWRRVHVGGPHPDAAPGAATAVVRRAGHVHRLRLHRRLVLAPPPPSPRQKRTVKNPGHWLYFSFTDKTKTLCHWKLTENPACVSFFTTMKNILTRTNEWTLCLTTANVSDELMATLQSYLSLSHSHLLLVSPWEKPEEPNDTEQFDVCATATSQNELQLPLLLLLWASLRVPLRSLETIISHVSLRSCSVTSIDCIK